MLPYGKNIRDVDTFANKEALIALLDQDDFYAHGDPVYMYYSLHNTQHNMIDRILSVYFMTHDQRYLAQEELNLAKSALLNNYSNIYSDLRHELRYNPYVEAATISKCRVNVTIHSHFLSVQLALFTNNDNDIAFKEGLMHVVDMAPQLAPIPEEEFFAINASTKRGRDDDDDDGYDRDRNVGYEMEQDEYPAYDVEIDDELTYLRGMKRGRDVDDDEHEYENEYPLWKVGGYRRTQTKKRYRKYRKSESRKSKSRRSKSKKSKSQKSTSKSKSKSRKSKSKKSRK